MGYQVNHGRIKDKYRPEPNAAEKRHEARLREEVCFGCGDLSECTHHTRLEFAGKRHRRDHRFQLPLCNQCHLKAHAVREPDWLASIGMGETDAVIYMKQMWAESVLLDKYEGFNG